MRCAMCKVVLAPAHPADVCMYCAGRIGRKAEQRLLQAMLRGVRGGGKLRLHRLTRENRSRQVILEA